MLQDIHPPEDDNLNLDEDDEITSAQNQRWSDHQNERLHKQPMRRQRDSQGTYERAVPKKRPRSIVQETVEDIEAKNKRTERYLCKLQTHRDNDTCPKILRYNARANIAPDEEFKNYTKLTASEKAQNRNI